MKWLFLMFLLDTSAGEVRPKMQAHAVFNSEEECNRLGQEVAAEIAYEDKSLTSFSTCIPESVFQAKGLQVDRVK